MILFFLSDLDKNIEVEEKGKDFKENAKLKAHEYSKLVDFLTISSDGGTFIPALGNDWDSLLTHRFAGKEATDLDRVNKILEIMKDYKGNKRKVYFKEAIVLGKKGRLLFSHQAKSDTRYLTDYYNPEKFIEGFWIANLLYYPSIQKHYVDLSEEERIGALPNTHWAKLKREVQNFVKSS